MLSRMPWREQGEEDKDAAAGGRGEVGGAGARPEVTNPKEARREDIDGQDEGGEYDQERARFCEEDLAGLDREAGERQAIAEAGEQRLPLEGGQERGRRHRQGDERQLIGAHLAQHLDGGEARVLHAVVALHVGLDGEDSDREQRGEDAGRDLLPFAVRRRIRYRRSGREMPEQLELARWVSASHARMPPVPSWPDWTPPGEDKFRLRFDSGA